MNARSNAGSAGATIPAGGLRAGALASSVLP